MLKVCQYLRSFGMNDINLDLKVYLQYLYNEVLLKRIVRGIAIQKKKLL